MKKKKKKKKKKRARSGLLSISVNLKSDWFFYFGPRILFAGQKYAL